MRKPIYQLVIERASKFFAGLFVLGSILDAFSNAINLITPMFSLIGTFSIISLWLIVELVLRCSPIQWVDKQGNSIRLKRFGIGLRWSMVGVIGLLWVPSFVKSEIKESQFRPHLKFEVGTDGAGNFLRANLTNTGQEPANNVVLQLRYYLPDGVQRVFTDTIGVVQSHEPDVEAMFWVDEVFKELLKRGSVTEVSLDFVARYDGISTPEKQTTLKYRCRVEVNTDGSRWIDLERLSGSAK